MIWSKKFYHFGVDMWLRGDPSYPAPPSDRGKGGNAEWRHFYCDAVVSLPAPWEYPWPACWDLCLHTPALCLFDPEWTKRQLLLFTREWMMHPNGSLPAYEYNFQDSNPPVHAWASLRVYNISRAMSGSADVKFLERCYHKNLLYFTHFANRFDLDRNDLFQAGFLGLDNI